MIAVDTETTGVNFYDEAFSVQIAWDSGDGVQSHYFELANGNAYAAAENILKDTPTWVFHNAKFDLQKLILAGIINRADVTSERIEDVECAFHLLHDHDVKKLKVLAAKYLGADTSESKAIKEARKRLKIKVDEGFHNLPREVVVPYAIRDAEFTLLLWQMFKGQVVAELEELYDLEMELTLVLLDMEARGLRVDQDYLERKLKEYKTSILKQELLIERLTGKKVWYPDKPGRKTPEGHYNPNAWQQTLALLRDRQVHVTSTSVEELKPLDDKFAQAVLELRALKKIYTTYFVGLQRETRDGIIHPNIRQHGTNTGRVSSGKAEDG